MKKRIFAVTLMFLFVASFLYETSAKDKRIITHEEFLSYSDECKFYSDGTKFEKHNQDDTGRTDMVYDAYFDWGKYANLIKSMDGAYQENGIKIYTVLNGKTKTIKKTGKYSIIVGGKKAKDVGYVKFVAPKSGTYKFTFDIRENVARDRVVIYKMSYGIDFKSACKYQYYDKFGNNYPDSDPMHPEMFLLSPTNEPCTDFPKHIITCWLGIWSYEDSFPMRYSVMKKMSATAKLKKNESILLKARHSEADIWGNTDSITKYDENYVGFDMKISCVK